MPLVRIDLLEGKSGQYRAQVGDILYQALVDVLNVPEHDRFQVITEPTVGGFDCKRLISTVNFRLARDRGAIQCVLGNVDSTKHAARVSSISQGEN